MDLSNFIVVGENIHCTRIVKRDGNKMTTLADGTEGVSFKHKGKDAVLPVPAGFDEFSPAYAKGKCKHVQLAVYQMLNGDAAGRQAGADYLCSVAEKQIKTGATFLDVNVDEYTSDAKTNNEVMAFVATFLGERYDTPLSIDSSHPDVLATGLAHCRTDIRPPMVNSVSLERVDAIDIVKQFNADAIVSAAGAHDLPKDADGRLANFRQIVPMLTKAGVALEKLHLDPLVLGVGTGDHLQGKFFLEATTRAKAEFAGVHLNGGLSNVSFGLPNRKLLNTVFIWLCVQAGTDGGIVDPAAISLADVAKLDTTTEEFRLARAALTGEDEYCMDYVMAMK